MSDCTDLFYCRLNVYQWRYAEVVLCVRDLVTVSVLHRTISFIELSLYLSGLYPLQA